MASKELKQYTKRVIREFLITTSLLGSSFFLAMFSTFLIQQVNEFRLAVVAAGLSLVLAFAGGIYIVPKLARRVNLRLFSLRFPYSATPETAFFVVLTVIVGFSAFNTGNNLLYLIFSVLLAVLLSSGIISEASLRNLDVSLRFPEHIFATKETYLDLSLINRKRFLPSFSLTVGVMTETAEKPGQKKLSDRMRRFLLGPQLEKGLGKLAHYATLPGSGKISQRLAYTFSKRGAYHIIGFLVSTKFPFGFLRKTHEKEATGEVIVYPRSQQIRDFSAVVPVLAGWLESPQRGSGSDLYLIRQYSSNDNMRHIDWKATAKSRQLMVKEYTREDERRISIVLDDYWDKKMPDFEERFERAVELAASLADHFTKQGSEIRLLTPEHQTGYDTGQDHLFKMLRILALIEPHRDENREPDKEVKSVDELLNEEGKDLKIGITGAPLRLRPHATNIRIIGLNQL
jgi:uncharacterized protein (DUF58 family)